MEGLEGDGGGDGRHLSRSVLLPFGLCVLLCVCCFVLLWKVLLWLAKEERKEKVHLEKKCSTTKHKDQPKDQEDNDDQRMKTVIRE